MLFSPKKAVLINQLVIRPKTFGVRDAGGEQKLGQQCESAQLSLEPEGRLFRILRKHILPAGWAQSKIQSERGLAPNRRAQRKYKNVRRAES